MRINKKKYTTIWLDKDNIKIIDQTKLPFEVVEETLKTTEDYFTAIKDMKVRGAPLIGITAAFGLAMSLKINSCNSNLKKTYLKLLSARPTAVNLKWAMDIIMHEIQFAPQKHRFDLAIKKAIDLMNDDIKKCKRIGEIGFKLIQEKFKKKKTPINILTHCNAGWLATVDWGTALSPIFLASRRKIPLHVWVDETRPRNQGALLTAWELKNENIAYTIIVDNAGGHLMQQGKVDLCLVGSDRTAMNGDVCNKIGTYLKAIAAHQNKVPFYVALPKSTIDKKLAKGVNMIEIEHRDANELTDLNIYKNKKFEKNRIYFDSKNVFNPAFDVTPSKYITALITEEGIIQPHKKEIKNIFKLNDK